MLSIFKILLFQMLDRRQRLRLTALVLVGMITAILEGMSVYMVLPFIEIMSARREVDAASFFPKEVADFVNGFDMPLNGLFFVILSIFLAKSIVLSFCAYFKHSVINETREKLAKRLFGIYLNKDKTFVDAVNSSELVTNMSAGIHLVSSGLLGNSIIIFIEVTIVFCILSVTLLVNHWIVIIAPITLGLFGYFFILMTKRLVKNAAKQRAIADKNKIKTLNETFASLLEIKVYGAQKIFTQPYEKYEHQLMRTSRNISFLSELPRINLDTLIICMLFFVIYLISFVSGNNYQNALATNGLLAAALIKMAPSFNRIIVAFNGVKFAIPAMLEIAPHLETEPAKLSQQERHDGQRSLPVGQILIRQLSFKYKTNSDYVFKNIDMTINAGDIVGVVGESGSGKSTLLHVILNLLSPTAGSVEFFASKNFSPQSLDLKQVAFIPQTPSVLEASIAENVAFGYEKNEIDQNKLQDSIEKAQALFVSRLPEKEQTIIAEDGNNFSGGQIQRLMIARALYSTPSIMIFDEATNALDAKNETAILKLIKDLSPDKIIFIVSHSQKLMRVCDKIIDIQKYKI